MADYFAPFLPAPSALVGRAREQAALRDTLAATLAGRGALILIGGEAGIGKTALAEALLAEAAATGARVLVGRCYDLAETPPYWPWAEALGRAPLSAGLPAPPDFAGGREAASQAALFAHARDYLAALAAGAPLVLLLEDLHWADPASLDLLRTLGRGLAELPLLLLATYRVDELTRRHPLYALLPTLEREARAQRLNLRRFDAESVQALVAVRAALPAADADRLARWLLARAEGNAFFTAQLLRSLEDQGTLSETAAGWALGDLGAVGLPDSLRRVLDARLARLGEEARHFLALAAVIGQEVPLATWATVAGTDEEALLDTIERAVEARLLAETPDGAAVRFAHALIRETLYEGTLATRRRRVHRQVADALLATTTPASGYPDPDAVAYHLRQAGDERAAEWLVRAGERAQRAYAWVSATARYEAALAVLEARDEDAGRRGWLAFRLGALRRYGDPRQGLGNAEEAIRLAGMAGDQLLTGVATYLAGLLTAGHLGDSARGLPLMEAGLEALGALPPAARVPPGATEPLDPAVRWGSVMQRLADNGRYAEVLARGERYLAEVAPPTRPDWLGGNGYADAHAALGLAHAGLGRPEQARTCFARARELNRAVGHYGQARLLAVLGLEVLLAFQADQPATLRPLLAEAAADQLRAREMGSADLPHDAPPQFLVLTGRWGEARQTAEAVRAQASPGSYLHVVASAALGRLEYAQGAAARAEDLVAELLPDGPAMPPGARRHWVCIGVQRQAAALALDAGDLARAQTWLAAHDRWLAWSGGVLGQAEGHLGWAAYHRAAGDLIEARRQAETAHSRATEPHQPLALLAAHRLLGELDTAEGRHADAVAHLDTALALADACAAPYERALTLLALAELRAATGDRDGARHPLEGARALLAPLEARPALARADALAARLADPATAPPAPALPAGLSAREVEVLRLVARGLTNAQVAERLFLSPRTIDQHLRSIYGKLGVENRAGATAFAVEHGLR